MSAPQTAAATAAPQALAAMSRRSKLRQAHPNAVTAHCPHSISAPHATAAPKAHHGEGTPRTRPGNATQSVPQSPKYIAACAALSAGTPKARTNPQNQGASTSARRLSPSANDSHVTVPSTAKAKPRRAHSQPFSNRSLFMGG